MIASAAPLRRVFRRELLVLYIVVCLADVFVGLALPLFPLIAQRLGASLLFTGFLTAISAAVQVSVGLPLGILADRRGRGTVIILGITLFVVAAALLIWAPSPMWLIPAQIAIGAGIVATFIMGSALAGSLSQPEERGTVMGLYTTAMGIGFTAGPLIGGLLAHGDDLSMSVLAAGSIGLVALLLAIFGLPRRNNNPSSTTSDTTAIGRVRVWSWALVFACLANFLFSPIFGAVVITFVPLQAKALGFATLAIGSLLSLRAFTSTVTRLPTGLISTIRWSKWLMLLALLVGGAAVVGLAIFQNYAAFIALLMLEGVSYGIFITSSQAFVAQRTDSRSLGAALGTYNMAGGISAALSPFLLGIVADHAGITAVFWYVGALALLGAVVLMPLLRYTDR